MIYTAQELVTEAFFLSQIVSKDFQTVSDPQLQTGLNRLNGFIGNKGAKTKMIPFYQVVNGNFIAGQEVYFIPNLVHIETLTFFLLNVDETNSVRFEMSEETRYRYFATGRAENVKSLPYQWHLERVYGGSNLYVYFLPQENYPYQMNAKFLLDSVALNQDLSLIFERSYIEYMLYGLAVLLCEYYDVMPPISVIQQFKDYESDLMTQSPIDLTMRKISSFGGGVGLLYADANMGKGIRPVN